MNEIEINLADIINKHIPANNIIDTLEISEEEQLIIDSLNEDLANLFLKINDIGE